MHEEPIRQSFPDLHFDIHKSLCPRVFFDLWKRPRYGRAKKELPLQIGIAETCMPGSKIGPGPVEERQSLGMSRNRLRKVVPRYFVQAWVRVTFQQLLTKVAVKRSVYFRPIRSNTMVFRTSVAAKVIKGEPEIQGVEDWRFESITERKLERKSLEFRSI